MTGDESSRQIGSSKGLNRVRYSEAETTSVGSRLLTRQP